MQINGRKVGSFEITTYYTKNVDGTKIVIEKVKVLDEDGKYIKFAKLEGVIQYLSKYTVTFKSLEDE
jgi:hypothetical protein